MTHNVTNSHSAPVSEGGVVDLASQITLHSVPRFPVGFRCASKNVGLKKQGRDLSLFFSETEAEAAAVFTLNQFPGAPVTLGREVIKGGRLSAVVVNSKVSNVATGESGIANARRMARAAANELSVNENRVLVSSTGVIGVQLPIDRIESGISGFSAALQDDPIEGALGIMTTDTHPKAISTSVGDATITWVAKGSGMIEPNMATMLAYIFTDARIDAADLDAMLRRAVSVSFNMLSVDTDTSTSDTCVIMANGMVGSVDLSDFERVLTAGCVKMAEILARDGEGAEHLLRVTVNGAVNEAESRYIAKSLVNSPLIKTMVHGADPNVGRIVMAVGKCFNCVIEPAKTSAWINSHLVVHNGLRADFEDAVVRGAFRDEIVDIIVDLGVGAHSATAFGCDLTNGYIGENAAYYSS